MDEVNDPRLSFPQKHWLLLCIIIAILSPTIVLSLRAVAHKKSHDQALEQKPVRGGDGGLSPSGGAVAPGDSAKPGSINPVAPTVKSEAKDTSYKVAAPPQH